MSLNTAAVSKGRPRASKHGHVYTPKKTRDFEKFVKDRAALCVDEMIDYPVFLHINITEVIPKSWPKWKREAARLGLIFPQRGDTDNKFKTVADALNGVVYLDDSLIADIGATKRYGNDHFIRVRVYKLGPPLAEVIASKHNLEALTNDCFESSPEMGGRRNTSIPM